MNKKRIVSLACTAVLAGTMLAGCKGGGSASDLNFWVYGSPTEVATYTDMVDTFNAGYGKDHGIKVHLSSKPPSSYNTTIAASASTKSGPDVFLGVEDNFKKNVNAGLIADITEELNAVSDIKWDDIYESTTNRLKYDINTNTSNSDDPLYGLPIDTKPTALYYNESLFKKANVLVISVDAKDIEAWNKDEIADKRGKKKSDYVAENPALASLLQSTNIPAKGYFRSLYPYVGKGNWRMPQSGELLVFNNRIAMNWDEVEDLSRMFVPTYNPLAESWIVGKGDEGGVEYGYFTEWWFNYGWAVGGDCLEDLTGNGDWNFSLLDPNPNYIVAKDTYTGAYTGTVYTVGETLCMNDKLNVPKGEKLEPDEVGGYTYGGNEVTSRPELAEAVAQGTLKELPSTREAFTRYLKLGTKTTAKFDEENGLDISPNPNLFNTGRNSTNYFFSGKIAMLVNYSIYMADIADYAKEYGFEWDVAPLVVYKEYENKSDPQNDKIVVEGKTAGHNNSISMVVRQRSTKKDKAAAFIAWMASKEGQSLRAKAGFFPNQLDLCKDIEFKKGVAPSNVNVFAEAIAYQSAGDWWYMPDYEWINVWAVPLNTYVRNDSKDLDFDKWHKQYVKATNEKLLDYKVKTAGN